MYNQYVNYKSASLKEHLKKHWWKYVLGLGALGLAGLGAYKAYSSIKGLREELGGLKGSMLTPEKAKQMMEEIISSKGYITKKEAEKMSKIEAQKARGETFKHLLSWLPRQKMLKELHEKYDQLGTRINAVEGGLGEVRKRINNLFKDVWHAFFGLTGQTFASLKLHGYDIMKDIKGLQQEEEYKKKQMGQLMEDIKNLPQGELIKLLKFLHGQIK